MEYSFFIKETVEAIIRRYCNVHQTDFQKIFMGELYRSLSKMVHFLTTSQGAESQMSEPLKNHILSVDSQQIITKFLYTQRSDFIKHQRLALNFANPVPLHVEQHRIAYLNVIARYCQHSVDFIDLTDQMEETVSSFTDGTKIEQLLHP